MTAAIGKTTHGRETARLENGTQAPGYEKCHICRGLMTSLAEITRRIAISLEDYEFKTFLVGATIPTQFYEREDSLRARLKIRGKESIKSHLTREIGLRLSRVTGATVEYLQPDVTIFVSIAKESEGGTFAREISIRPRPILLAGRYTKSSRGIPQKQEKCGCCAGKGCNACNFSGLSAEEASIEAIVASTLVKEFKGRGPKFTWLGSEDRSSLVLGDGRPFYVKIFCPKLRSKKKPLTVHKDGISASLRTIEEKSSVANFVDDRMDHVNSSDDPPYFLTTTRITVGCTQWVSDEALKKLEELAGSTVRFEKNKSRDRIALKKIYSSAVEKFPDSPDFILTITADGGLPIKQFVGGQEYIKPSITEILGVSCQCRTFDILDVKLQQVQ